MFSQSVWDAVNSINWVVLEQILIFPVLELGVQDLGVVMDRFWFPEAYVNF